MPGAVHIPWYATGFRGDQFEAALLEIAPIAMRYGATAYEVFRYRDDRYKFLQSSVFESKLDWERYWDGPEMIQFRAANQGRYQVPVVYQWTDIVAEARMPANGNGNGGEGEPETAPVGGGSAGDTI
jgi:hypothetical protein